MDMDIITPILIKLAVFFGVLLGIKMILDSTAKKIKQKKKNKNKSNKK